MARLLKENKSVLACHLSRFSLCAFGLLTFSHVTLLSCTAASGGAFKFGDCQDRLGGGKGCGSVVTVLWLSGVFGYCK